MADVVKVCPYRPGRCEGDACMAWRPGADGGEGWCSLMEGPQRLAVAVERAELAYRMAAESQALVWRMRAAIPHQLRAEREWALGENARALVYEARSRLEFSPRACNWLAGVGGLLAVGQPMPVSADPVAGGMEPDRHAGEDIAPALLARRAGYIESVDVDGVAAAIRITEAGDGWLAHRGVRRPGGAS